MRKTQRAHESLMLGGKQRNRKENKRLRQQLRVDDISRRIVEVKWNWEAFGPTN